MEYILEESQAWMNQDPLSTEYCDESENSEESDSQGSSEDELNEDELEEEDGID